MKNATLLKVLMVPAMLGMLMATVRTAPAAEAEQPDEFWCHSPGVPTCAGSLTVGDSDVSYQMTGTPSLAKVSAFSSPSKTRNVTWVNLDMKGTTATGDAITATLDSNRTSSGTVLSISNKEFPATATMRFFFRIETGGMKLVSDQPAVFQGIIHSIPPGPGDVLTMISRPVQFHPEGDPDLKLGALKVAEVSFTTAK